jgi:hypothetical protein
MTTSFNFGLASWIMQDEDYSDFKTGDTASSALGLKP